MKRPLYGTKKTLCGEDGLSEQAAAEVAKPKAGAATPSASGGRLRGLWAKFLKGLKPGSGRYIALLILAGLFVLKVFDPLPVQFLRVKTFDTYQNIKPREDLPQMQSPATVVDIDEKSLSKIGQWPWPRTKIADLIYNLNALGASVVAFDIVFAEHDRLSPGLIAAGLPVEQSIKDTLLQLPSNDQSLGDAIRNVGGSVVLGQTVTEDAGVEGAVTEDLPKTSVAYLGMDGQELKDFVPPSPALIRNVRELDEAALGRGVFNVDPDVDGIIRRVPTLKRVGDTYYPALSMEALRLFGKTQTVLVRAKKNPATGQKLGIQDLVIKPFVIKTDKSANVWVYYRPYSRKIYVSASDVLDGSVDPAMIKGKIIFLGTSAAGLKDIRSTPLDRFLPGVDLHAQIIENVFDAQLRQETFINDALQSKYKDMITRGQSLVQEFQAKAAKGEQDGLAAIQEEFQTIQTTLNTAMTEIKRDAPDFQLFRPRIAEDIELMALLFIGMVMIVLVPWVGAKWTLTLLALGTLSMVGGSWFAFSEKRMLFDPVMPSVSALTLYIVLTYTSYSREEAQRRQVRGAFSRYMSPALVERLAEDPTQLKLGGEMRDMTLLFCDVRGFTTISEQFDAQGLTKLINKFLTPMTNVILDRKGTIDKYMGDCIMAFWNAPLDDPDHARNACKSALVMLDSLDVLNAQLEVEAKEEGRKFIPIHIGIGLNSGDVCVGNMGSDQRFDYSVLGDTVNLASRLEGQSKTYGVLIVIGDATRERASDYATLELDMIKVKGKTVPVRIHTLMGSPEMAQSAPFKALAAVHGEMIQAYKSQNWALALENIEQCRELSATLGVDIHGFYDLYVDRIHTYQENPPGADWDGSYTATSK